MTPYYEDDAVTIYHGDNREILPLLTGIGLVVTSPPYNLNGDGNVSAGTAFRNLGDGYASYSDDMPHDLYVGWQRHTLRLLWATLADDGAIYYNHKVRVGGDRCKFPHELVPADLPIRQQIVWDRGSGFNRQFTYYVPRHELILLIAKPAFRINTRSVDDVWNVTFETGGVDHPAPFPLKLTFRVSPPPCQYISIRSAGKTRAGKYSAHSMRMSPTMSSRLSSSISSLAPGGKRYKSKCCTSGVVG